MRHILITGVMILTASTFVAAAKSVPSHFETDDVAHEPTQAFLAEKEALIGEVASLKSELQNQTSQIALLAAERDQFQQDQQLAIAAQEATLTKVEDTQAALESAQAELAKLTDNAAAYEQQIAALTEEKSQAQSQVLAAEKMSTDAETQLLALSETLQGERETVYSLQAEIAEADIELAALTQTLHQEREAGQSQKDQLAVATAQTASLQTRIAELEANRTALSDAQVSEMNAQLDGLTAALDGAETRISALTAEVDAQAEKATVIMARAVASEEQVAALQAEKTGLIATLSDRVADLAAIRASQNTSQADLPTVASCASVTAAVFDHQKLRFETGTNIIAPESVPSLEQWVSDAQACVDTGLTVEIGGHTDSQGGERSNQKLSEARARAVVDFLYTAGVPSVAMHAVGYGESDPIADNSTRDGRSANRRITFLWQQN